MPAPFKLTGLVAAPFTPMRPDGSVNLDAIPAYAALLREQKVSGAFVCGTTGECHSLTVAERRAVAERWVAAAGDDLRVIVHVGSHSLPDARELAAHAQDIGAAAVSALAPGYFKPAGVDDLVEFCAAVAAAAPRLPFYYYHIPSMTGVTLSAADVLRRGAARIPTLAGVKFTHNDLMMLQECLAVDGLGGGGAGGGPAGDSGGGGRPDVVYGSDETLLAGLAFGLGGAVGSTYNYAAPVYHELMRAFAAGDLPAARRAQAKSVALVKVLVDFGVARTGKAIMEMVGVDCGPVRSPLRPLGLEERYAVYDRLKPLEIFPRPLRRP